MVLRATEPLRGFHQGRPSDAAIQFLQSRTNESVDENPEGFLLCTPLAPLSGASALTFMIKTKEHALKHQVRCATTLNILTSRVLEAVISAHFSRTCPEEKIRAHAFVNELTESFSHDGFYPYRINIDQQLRFTHSSPTLLETVRSLKATLDPNGIISPGRYEF